MSDVHFQYVIVGAGAASHAAAEAIRRRDAISPLLIVGQEHSRPYDRTRLSKDVLRHQRARAELAIASADWYAANDVTLQTGRRAVRLDTARHSITLDTGTEIAFDRLLLATGGSPRLLTRDGASLPNIFYLRSIEDSIRIRHAADKALRDGLPQKDSARRGRVIVAGAGKLGVEIAASLAQFGLQVDLLCGDGLPLHRLAGESAGRLIARNLESTGVQMHVGERAEKCEGDGRVQRVITSSGRSIACDFVVAAVGMIPNRELLRGTPIMAETSILTDTHCRTSAANIFAAGDCAAAFDPLFGKHRMVDHWSAAQAAGNVAGANMAGDGLHLEGVFSHTIECGEREIAACGEPRLVDYRLVRNRGTSLVEIGVAGDHRVAHVIAIGESIEPYSHLVLRRFDVRGREESLKDPALKIGELLA